MNRVSSALLMSLLIPTLLQAQRASIAQTDSISVDSVRAPFVFQVRQDSVHSETSHAVRNGAITGAVIGAVAGGYAASLLGFGCKLILPPPGQPSRCTASRDAAVAVTAGTVLGALTVGLIGAGLGKIWRWLD